MRLIFVTRKIDYSDTRVGFVNSWIKSLSKEVSELIVICLEKGNPGSLPENVRIFSMGKENGYSRLKILKEYRKLLAKFLPDSEGIFVHMHPIYAIAAWTSAKKYKKKMLM